MKTFFTLVILVFFGQSVASQTLTQTLRGTVRDNVAKTPIPGVTVFIVGSEPVRGANTDAEGNFRFDNVPVGRHTLRFTSVGYEERFVSELTVGSGKEVVLAVGLTESLVQMQEITISAAEQEKGTPRNEMAAVSARSISVDETKRYAASVNDPARAALSFAGVATNDDGSNGIVVRGNSPRGMLWRLEGVEVPNPNHFGEEGASSGGISILSVNMLDNSDFMTGAFPAEYGNALSGVFDIRLRRGNNEKREYAAQAGLLGLDFAAEGPFSKRAKASYLANYRYSTLGILKQVGVDLNGGGTPEFQDFAYKLHIPTAKAGTFSVWGIGGLSRQQREAPRDSAQWQTRFDRTQDKFISRMAAFGLTHLYYMGPQTYVETALSFSGRQSNYYRDTLARDYSLVREYDESFANQFWRLSVLFNHKFNARHTLRAGGIVSQIGFQLGSKWLNDEQPRRLTQLVDNSGSTQTLQAYVQWKYRISEQLTLNTGAHLLHLRLNGSQSLEPRASLKWQFAARQSVAAGAGLHSRYEALSMYFAQQRLGDRYVQPNRNLGLTKAGHLVLAYENQLRDDLRLKVETYYQHLYKVPVGARRNAFSALNLVDGFVTDSLANTGTGRNYGLETTLEKFFTGKYYLIATGSVYNARYTGSDGVERNGRYNGRFVANTTFGREWTLGRRGTNTLGANVRLLWAGGNRYTPIDLARSRAEGKAVYHENRSYTLQAANYFRTDLRVSYKINRPQASHTLSLDVQNASNRLNVFSQYYDAEKGDIRTAYMVGLIPVLNYRVEF